MCRKCYIHPAIFEGYLDGTLVQVLEKRTKAYLSRNIEGLSAEEAAVAAFLRLRLAKLAEAEAGAGGIRRRQKVNGVAQASLESPAKRASAADHLPPPRAKRRAHSAAPDSS